MKNERLYTFLCAAGICCCLGLGSVGSMATGLDLPVNPVALVILCVVLAGVIAGLTSLRYGSLIVLGVGGIFLLNPDFLTELKTLAGAVARLLRLAYGIPTPEFLQGEYADQVLLSLCFLAGLIMVAAGWAIHRRKTVIPAAALSLLPLACCITVTDTVPDSGGLFLWGLGLVLLLMTQGTRLKSEKHANRLTAILLIPTVLSLLLLFRLVPRNDSYQWPEWLSGYFSQSSGLDTGGFAAPDTVNLSTLGKRNPSQTPVMEVTADFTDTLYLRSRDYDQYTGTAWTSTEGRTEAIYGLLPEFYREDGTVKIALHHPRDLYYLPAVTQQVQRLTDGQAPNPNREQTYQFEHCTLRSDWQTNWDNSQTSTVNPRYLKLPDDTIQGAWTYLNAQEAIREDGLYNASAPVTAELIRQMLLNHVPYDLSTRAMPQTETDLAIWFLNDAQSGYCVHYATAAVVLLRACGIPARYVEGYTIHVEDGKTATVREAHAHAWAEYYVNGIGWMILEATPSAESDPQEPVTTPATQSPPESLPTTNPTLPSTTPSNPTVPTQIGTKPNQTDGEMPPAWVNALWRTVLWVAVLWVLLWAQYRLRRMRFHRSLHRGNANRRALTIHRRLCRLARWTKQPVPPELTQLAQKARFSQHTLTPPELSRLKGHLKLTESAVSLLPLPKRLLAKWLFARY